jgi:hypothetical protein
MAQTYGSFEVVFVDNGSKDESVSFVKEYFPETKIISLTDNLGFAGGNIIGYKYARGDYICLLNNDTKVSPIWLEKLVYAMDKHPEVGMCASKLVIEGTSLINSCGDGLTTAGMGYQIGQGEPKEKYSQERYVFGGYGAAVLLRKDMLDKVGFLDEKFFLIYEEDDLSFRAQLLGWKCIYVPEAVVHHKLSSSIKTRSDLAVYHMARNIEWVWIKNMPRYFIFRYIHHKIIHEIAEFCFFTMIGRFRACVKGKADAVKALPEMLNKRKAIQVRRKVSNEYLEQIFSSMWQVMFLTIKRLAKSR